MLPPAFLPIVVPLIVVVLLLIVVVLLIVVPAKAGTHRAVVTMLGE